jgi:phosphoglucosamine mutase
MLGAAVTAGLLSGGADARPAGVLPTPALAELVRQLGAQAGVVLSASHNPAEDNGIKLFGGDGFKLDDAAEAGLEAALAEGALPAAAWVAPAELGRFRPLEDAGDRYLAHLRGAAQDLRLDGLRLVLDCAHGAAYQVGPILLHELGAQVEPVGCAPDGLNINQGTGALYPLSAGEAVRQSGAALGLALDGDADRLVLVDETGAPVDGDELLAILARGLLRRGLLRGGVALTVMSNLGLEVWLREQGLEVVRTAVGDRYVVEALRQRGWTFGGEPAGHVVFLNESTTGDGLLAALYLLREVRESGQPVSQLRRGIRLYPQVLHNVNVAHTPPLETLTDLAQQVAAAETALGERGRVLLRYSGTEPKLRIMVEGEDAAVVEAWCQRLADAALAALGGPA